MDELVLSSFFAGGYERVGLNPDDFTVEQRTHRSFYADAAEAEANAVLYFEQPPQLLQYSEYLRPQTTPIYAVSENDWGGLVVDFVQCQ